MAYLRCGVAVLVCSFALAHVAGAAPFAYIPNTDADAVSVIDAATNTVVGTIPVGRGPTGVAANDFANRIYVLNALDSTVSVIDAAARSVIATVPVAELGGAAAGLAITRDGTRLYVANPPGNTLTVVDTVTNDVSGSAIAVGDRPFAVAVSPSGAQVYVTNGRGNSLSIVDAGSSRQIGEIAVGSTPLGVAVHPAGTAVYVATSEGLAIVDPRSMTLVGTVPLEDAYGVAASPDAARVYVTTDEGRELVVIDPATRAAIRSIAVGSRARGVSVTADGRIVHVSNAGDATVSMIDTSESRVIATVAVLSNPAALGAFLTDLPPVAEGEAVLTAPGVAVAVALSATDQDGDRLTYTIVDAPRHGSLSGAAPNLTYTPAAAYSGPDSFSFVANDGASNSNKATVAITIPSATSTAVTSNINPSTYGQAITLTAKVGSGDGIPDGTVQFFDGASALGTVALAGGFAALTTTAVGAGTRSIAAVYTPSGLFNASTSSPLGQTVNKATGTTSLTLASLTPQYSDLDTFTATFTPATAGGPAPSTVRFKVGTQVVADAPVLLAGGVYKATWTGQLTQNKPASYVVTASVTDQNFAVPNALRSMTIFREDARVAYQGATSVSFQGSASGVVPLIVAVKDITAVTGDPEHDSNPGDIRNAQVLFIDRATNAVLGTASITGADPSSGTARLDWGVDLGTAKSKRYAIGFIVFGYYYRNSTTDNVVVTVSK